MEKRPPLPKPAVPKGLVLVGKGPPLIKAKDLGGAPGGPSGAKLALHGTGPPPGKTALPKPGPLPGAPGGEAVSKPSLPGVSPPSPLSNGGPPSPLKAPAGGLVKPAVVPPKPTVKPALPTTPQAPSAAAEVLPNKSSLTPLPSKPLGGPPASLLKKPTAAMPAKPAAATSAAATPPASSPGPPLASKEAKALPGPPASKTAQQSESEGPSAAPAAPQTPKPPGGGLTASPGKKLPPAAPKQGEGGAPGKPAGGPLKSTPKGPPASPSDKPAGADGQKIPSKGGPPSPAAPAGGEAGGLQPPASSIVKAKSESPSAPGSIRVSAPSGKEGRLRPEGPSSVDEFGRQRGSVGDLAPRSELAHDLLGRSVPVFDKAGNFVAYASGPPPALSRSDPSARGLSLLTFCLVFFAPSGLLCSHHSACDYASKGADRTSSSSCCRGLADRKPQVRDSMKGHGDRGAGGFDPGLLGGVNVPGGIPGFFMAVPPWPAPTPLPVDQLAGWGASPTAFGYPPHPPYVSPYAAYPPQPVGYYPPGCLDSSQTMMHAPPNYGGAQQQAQQPPVEETRLRASEKKVRAEYKATRRPSGQPADAASSVKEGKESRRRSSALPQFESGRARGYVMSRGDEEVGNSKWCGIERHLNNIRGGYGEASRPPEEADNPFRKPSARARHRDSGVRDEVYSGSGDPLEASGGKPVLPRRSNLLARPKDRTWDRWGTTGLTAPRRRTYQSLSELASCFSNLEPQDQDDVISLLLLCRKLEQRLEKQHVVIDMLEHDLSEAQKVLKFPPEWRSLENVDLAGMVPSDTPFQATAATPLYVKSATYLPANVPEEPSANFGVEVKTTSATTGQAPAAAQASPAAKAKVSSPAPPATPTAAEPKKLPAGMKPKAPLLGVKKPVFKKM
ncbi:hypothetical protein ACSSS7_000131 [Eimeria intestinalis]